MQTGSAMAQTVDPRPLTARVSPSGICGGQGGSATDLYQVLRFSAVNIISPGLHTHRPISYVVWNGCSLETQCRPISMDNNMQKSEGLVRFFKRDG
jgi:hypothetical protein